MNHLPIFLDVRGGNCLVVGGGAIAARKAARLVAAGGRVAVIAPALSPEMTRLIKDSELIYEARPFQDSDLNEQRLVIAATDDAQVNQRIAELARARDIPVNVADDASLGTFIMPSIIDRTPVIIAVSTGGASPVLARLLRARLEAWLPQAYGRLAALVENFRQAVKQRFPQIQSRRRFWEQVLQGPVAEQVLAGRDEKARALLLETLNHANERIGGDGEVYLVGAGPGDPDLLTFRALRLMQQADVVVFDRLVSQPILDLIPPNTERLYAGKERAKHTLPQESINELLVRLAKAGNRVCRLKGGDPFIFGRGGEEIATLMENGIPFQVVPGITAASGCAAYAGIPLTHRDYAQACIFATGHVQDGHVQLNWDLLARARQTLVFYMGLHGVRIICEQLVAHGLPATTPAALIAHGTTADQRILIGDLTTLPDRIEKSGVKAPTLIIVGEVVRLHDKLRWFDPTAETRAI